MAELAVPIPMTPRGFYSNSALAQNKAKLAEIGKKYFRETEVDNLIGDFTKAKKILKWKPKNSLNQLIDDMIQNEE